MQYNQAPDGSRTPLPKPSIDPGAGLERIVLSRAVRWHIENRILPYANKTVIFD